MKPILLVISLLLAIMYSQVLLAQNSDSTSSDVKDLEAQQQQTNEAKAKALQEEKEPSSPNKESSSPNKEPSSPTKPQAEAQASSSNKRASSKVFIPTEEISEDKPVAFPVDI